MTDVNLIGENHEALHRAVPYRSVIAKSVPWEYPVLIGQKQTVYAQVATYGYASVFLA